MGLGWPLGAVEGVVDHIDPSPRAQGLSELARIRWPVGDVVPRVHDEYPVHRRGLKRCVVGSPLPHLHVREPFPFGAFAHVSDHVRLDVDSDDRASCSDGFGQMGQEVAGSRADVSHRMPGVQPHQRDDLVRLLPGVALRVIEN